MSKNKKKKSKNKVNKNTQKNVRKNQFDINKFIKDNKDSLIMILISIIILVVASFVIGFLLSFILVAITDTIIWLLMHRKKKKGKKKYSVWQVILTIIFSFGTLVLLMIAAFFIYIAKTAPDFDPSLLYSKEASIIYDKNGEIVRKVGAQLRETITYDDLPQVLIDAIIATEDSRFFQHNGFDLPRFLKASFGQVLGKAGAGGASTLTMQLLKTSILQLKMKE